MGAFAGGAQAAPSDFGVSGVCSDMSPDQVAQALAAEGNRLVAQGAQQVEAAQTDHDALGNVRVVFVFDDAQPAHIALAEFIADDDIASRQHARWFERLSAKYNLDPNRQAGGGVVRDVVCHSTGVSISLTLVGRRAMLVYDMSRPAGGRLRARAGTAGFPRACV